MTRTIELTLRDNVYVNKDTEKVLCGEFVRLLIQKTPDSILVTASTEPISGAAEIGVMKCGYYRWWWQFRDRVWNKFGTYITIDKSVHPWNYLHPVEDTFNDFFPDAREDGLDKEKKLWVSVSQATGQDQYGEQADEA